MSEREQNIGKYQLEICSNSPFSALQAQLGGATRVELCQNLENGGTTPSYGQIRRTRELLDIGIHVLIRPRGGDFLYSDEEINEMILDIQQCKVLGIDGVVIGVLNADGSVDTQKTALLVAAARPLCVTFHRAFDCCCDPFHALEDIVALGIDRILTSGLQNSAIEGVDLLSKLISRAAGRIVIMPGAGVNADNIQQIMLKTNAIAIHSSAKEICSSGMEYTHSGVNGMDEDQYATSKEKVHQLVDLLKNL